MIVLLGEVKQGAGDSGIVGDKLTIEVDKVEEGLYILDFGESRPGSDAIKFDWVHSKLTGFHDLSKVFDFRDVKLALLKLQMKVKLSHLLEDMAGLLSVGFWVGGGNEEVIHINDKLSFSDHVSERVIHELLECDGV